MWQPHIRKFPENILHEKHKFPIFTMAFDAICIFTYTNIGIIIIIHRHFALSLPSMDVDAADDDDDDANTIAAIATGSWDVCVC